MKTSKINEIKKADGFFDGVIRFEKALDLSVAALRIFGIKAKVERERFGGKIYINVCIPEPDGYAF